MIEPIFKEGQVVRIKDPDGYISSFAKKVADRDAIVIKNVLDYGFGSTGNVKSFQGRVIVEFQRRNGRGKTFREIMQERDFVAKEQA